MDLYTGDKTTRLQENRVFEFHRFDELPAEIKERIYRFCFAGGAVTTDYWRWLFYTESSTVKSVPYCTLLGTSWHWYDKALTALRSTDRAEASIMRILCDWNDREPEHKDWQTLNGCLTQLARNTYLPADLFPVILEETDFVFENIDDFADLVRFWTKQAPSYHSPVKAPLSHLRHLDLEISRTTSWSSQYRSWDHYLTKLVRLDSLVLQFPRAEHALSTLTSKPHDYYLKFVCNAKRLKHLELKLRAPTLGDFYIIEDDEDGRHKLEVLQHVLRKNCQDKLDGKDVSGFRFRTSATNEDLQRQVFEAMQVWMAEETARIAMEDDADVQAPDCSSSSNPDSISTLYQD